ncbi:hypothetical protein KPB2_5364 [Klebsiella pneumoniae Kb677]|nr:hypothetical protein KPB2_5364 [Klebsiella pneumoniae Kb677]
MTTELVLILLNPSFRPQRGTEQYGETPPLSFSGTKRPIAGPLQEQTSVASRTVVTVASSARLREVGPVRAKVLSHGVVHPVREREREGPILFNKPENEAVGSPGIALGRVPQVIVRGPSKVTGQGFGEVEAYLSGASRSWAGEARRTFLKNVVGGRGRVSQGSPERSRAGIGPIREVTATVSTLVVVPSRDTSGATAATSTSRLPTSLRALIRLITCPVSLV